MHGKTFGKLLLPILLGGPGLAYGIGSTFQLAETVNGDFVPDTDSRQDRYADSAFGATVRFTPPLFDDDGNYLVGVGESWTWTWERTDVPEVFATQTVSYLGGDGMCWSDGNCGPLAAYSVGIKGKCIPEGTYRVSVQHNDAPLGSGDYRPTRFNPAVYDYLHASYIKPSKTATGEGDVGDYYIVISDDLGCGRPVENVEIKIKTHVVENDLSHGHLSNDYGTGKFISAGYESVVIESPPEVTGKTMENGLFRTRYQAGKHGVHETLATQLRRPATEIDPEIQGPELESVIRIQVPDLTEITEANAPVIFGDAGTCPHTPHPHWFTRNSLARMNAIAEAYKYVTDRRLSLNDASVAYGGVIDNKLKLGGGRDAPCHKSHRYGVDVDVNKTDSGGVDMLETEMLMDGKKTLLVKWVTHLVERFGGRRADEEPIHFRFPN